MKLLIINNFRLPSPTKQAIIAHMLDDIKSAVTVIAPKTATSGCLMSAAVRSRPMSEFARAARK